MHTAIPSQMQESTLAFVEPHKVPPCPTLHPVHVSLNESIAFQFVSCSSQLCNTGKLVKGAFSPFIQLTDEDVKTRPDPVLTEPWGMLLATGLHLDSEPLITTI